MSESFATRILSGIVKANGTQLGNGFSVEKGGPGIYRITFTSPFSTIPAVVCTHISDHALNEPNHEGGALTDAATVVTISTKRVVIHTGYLSGGTNTPRRDASFSFIAIGE